MNPFTCTNDEALKAYEKSITKKGKTTMKNETKQEHSPLPWYWCHITDSKPEAKIFGNNDWEVAETNGDDVTEKEANAAFIVKACNSHYEMVEALRENGDSLKGYSNWIAKTDTEQELINAIKLSVELSEQALKKVGAR